EVVESRGVRTYTTAEMAEELINLSTPEARRLAAQSPLSVDLTGGLGNEPLNITELREEAMARAAQDAAPETAQSAQG
ncbi:hypothetical protein, partial [Klebsiella pneumoniae]